MEFGRRSWLAVWRFGEPGDVWSLGWVGIEGPILLDDWKRHVCVSVWVWERVPFLFILQEVFLLSV